MHPTADHTDVSVIQQRVCATLALIALVALGAIAFHAQRGFGFVADEWDILAHYVDGHYLTPYNGHLSTIPVLIYQGLAHSIGIESYRPYGTIGIIVFLAIPVTFALTHRRSVDARVVWIAAAAIGWSWAAQMNLMYGFLVNFDLPIVMMLIAWWAIRHETLRGDLIASGALGVALASSSVGVIVAFALVFELVLRRTPLRRLIWFVPPVGAWGLWWIFRHEATTSATLGEYAAYAWHMTVGILAGFTWGFAPGAALVLAATIAIVWVAHVRWQTVDVHVVATLATLGVFIVVTSFSRAGDAWLNPPDSSRYVFFGDILLIAALVWCVRGRVLAPIVPAAVTAVAVFSAIPLVGHIDNHRSYVLDSQMRIRPALAAAQAAGSTADPSRNLPLNLIPVTTGQYLAMVDRIGSPLPNVPPQLLGHASDRRVADQTLIADEKITLQSAPDGAVCADRMRMIPATGSPLEPGSSYLVATDRGTPVTVAIRRFADPGQGTGIGKVVPGTTRLLALPKDTSRWPWWIDPQPGLSVCKYDGNR